MASTDVVSADVQNTSFVLGKNMVSFIIKGIVAGFQFMGAVLSFIGSLLVYVILPGFPFYLFILIAIILICVLWDDILRPLILAIVEGINGAIRSWNNVASSLRNLGFDIPIGGANIGIHFGIPVPDADELHLELMKFIPWCTEVLIPVLFIPLRKSLTGIIFAEDL
jgi:hypothetical protein